MTEATSDTNQPSSTEPVVVSLAVEALPVQIAADAHTEAQSVFASLVTKLENFEHALAADARADIEKLKTLLHL